MLSWTGTSLLLLLLRPVNAHVVFAKHRNGKVGPPPIRRAEASCSSASAEELEGRGDQLRAEKATWMRWTIRGCCAETTISAGLLNKMGNLRPDAAALQRGGERTSIGPSRPTAIMPTLHNLGVGLLRGARLWEGHQDYEKAAALNPSAASY